jgi:PAS domain S-box-containing protein
VRAAAAIKCRLVQGINWREPNSVMEWIDNDGERRPLEPLWDDGERLFCKTWWNNAEGVRHELMAVLPVAEHSAPATINRFAHEFALKDYLGGAWAARPLELVRGRSRTLLLLETNCAATLDSLLGQPMELGKFLRLAPALAHAVGRQHERGLVHKDIKPTNILIDPAAEQVWLTGFGIASRLPRERQAPEAPEFIAGTLAYMAPEQTGRMNRSVDSRSDLYALGITFYQMLTGALPFAATDPMEWVHCHIARKPVAPDRRVAGIPAPLSDIVMKLLAKRAEERYQTAAGVERDLQRCLAEWERGSLAGFPLGEQDAPDRLLIPEKLYGREREVETLLASFNRIVKSGVPELVLVSGYSGIGKSSVVNELHSVLVPPRGLFASGKFDQHKRDIPYSTVAQAFRNLIRPLLGKSEADLAPWRDALQEALGPNAALIADLVPEVKLIIGEPPPVTELVSKDDQRRFHLVFRRFLMVFARPEHPLALFLDDLQWLDAATLELLEDLLTHPDVQHLLLIGAYRDKEVNAAHPLVSKLEAMRTTGKVRDIKLGPLTTEDLAELAADSLRCNAEQVNALATLVHAKTGGNPFFVIQFLRMLADESLLAFDHEQARWSWDIGRIHKKRYTDNVVELLAAKLNRLPLDTQRALQQLACLGNISDVAMLSTVLGMSEEQVHAALWEALRQQLIDRIEHSYKFVHDRVQEAAYALIPTESRAEAHLTIGRLLASRTPTDKRDEAIFEIVNQLNRGAPLITSQDERERLAELNLQAGKRAKASSAYSSALTYLTAGAALLPKDAWERRQKLAFDLALHSADCEISVSTLRGAQGRLGALASHVVSTVQRCAVAHRRTYLHMMVGEYNDAIAVALECLRHVGIDWSSHPTELETRNEYDRIWSLLADRTIGGLIDLPLMQDPEALATIDVLTSLRTPALHTNQNLFALCVCRATNLSLERGNSEAAPANYVATGLIARARYGHSEEGYRLTKMACELLELHGWNHVGGRTYFQAAVNIPWTRPLREGIDPARRGFLMGKEHGDPAFAVHACRALNSILLAVGHPLDQLESEAEHGLAFTRPFGFVLDRISPLLALVRTLRGKTAKFGSLDDGPFQEGVFEERATGQPNRAFVEYYYWIRKLQARFFAGDYLSAINASDKMAILRAGSELSSFLVDEAEYHFYGALSRAALCEPLGPDPYAKHREALTGHERDLRACAVNCPENCEDRAALVGAEIARIEGRELDAERLYEAAIKSARKNEFVHNEALANELAARFYAARDFETIARAYLREARSCYLRWGADGKVRQLDRLQPHLAAPERQQAAAVVGSPVQHLDVASIVKASQALSSEIVLPRLIERLMTLALENAGADRGILILPAGDEYLIHAEAHGIGDRIEVTTRWEPITHVTCPESLVRYVIRTQESVILDDASKPHFFSADDYLRDRQSKSILCLPLIKQQELTGLLLLENTLTSHAFTAARIAVLELLAAQAAISLENTRLYGDLREREAKIRRLVDADIVGISIIDLNGQITEANDAFLRMLGCEREDLVSGHLRWMDLTPPEWHAADELRLEKIKTAGRLQPFEKEYFHKDGRRVPVLVGVARLEEAGNEAVAFVVDLTDRKQAEELARKSERRFHEAQMELAHMNRVATIGQLSASIAHEVNQPLSGVVTNASTFARMLAADPPNIAGALETARRAVRDANRASDIITRLRSLFAKKETSNELVNVNEVSKEIISLLQREFQNSGVIVRTEFTDNLPMVKGDRVQLQQVVLNLIRNGMDAMSTVDDRPRQLIITTAEAEPDNILVAVQDSGTGIDPTMLERVFDAFFTTKPDGLGMGLSICRTIIETHGGNLWATTTAPCGTILQFTLPAAV